MSYDHVTLFLPNGQTLRFYGVTNFKADTIVSFDYVSESDRQKKSGVFFFAGLVGFSCAAVKPTPSEIPF